MNNPPINIEEIMEALADKRPIFHSEADFQHALAWEIHNQYPEQYDIRLEYPVEITGEEAKERITVDIWLIGKQGLGNAAIELKYKKRKFDELVKGERFILSHDNARDSGCFDFMEDTRRIECLVEGHVVKYGAAIILSNEYLYWKKGSDKNTNFEMFSLDDGRIVDGAMTWKDGTGKGSKVKRSESIFLRNQYRLRWNTYQGEHGQFKWLMNEVLSCSNSGGCSEFRVTGIV